ncbi:MAG: hypothetical protein LC645_01670 [Geobacteraceae bacterium]|nr:hypothetical protein [Geobacteraceae bacterium]
MENLKNEVREEIKELQLGMKIRRMRQEQRLTCRRTARASAPHPSAKPRNPALYLQLARLR